MKHFPLILTLLLCLLGLTACACSQPEDEHVHDWDDGVVIAQPTCTAAGTWLRTCRICSENTYAAIPVTGHTFSTVWSYDASQHWHACLGGCGTDTDRQAHTFSGGICIICGAEEEIGGSDDTDGSGDTDGSDDVCEDGTHRWTLESRTEATCTQDGVLSYRCTLCGITMQQTIAALGHDPDPEWCYDDSMHWHICRRCGGPDAQETHLFLGGSICLTCGAEREEQSDIGHTHDWDDGVLTHEPTCTQTGTRLLTCRDCGITMTEEVPPTGHDFGTRYTANATAHWRVCANGCGETDTPEAHRWREDDIISVPTCTATGLIRSVCTVCDMQTTEVLPLAPHSAGAVEYNDSFHWSRCTACGATLEASDHVWALRSTTPPTCTSTGAAVYGCTGCDAVRTEELAVTAHNWSAWSPEEDGHARSCLYGCGAREWEAHRYEGDTCAVCGETNHAIGLIFVRYDTQTDGYMFAGSTENAEEIIIPDTYDGLPVVAIASEAFLGLTALRHITIGDNVTEILPDAFMGCTQLASITFGASLTPDAIDAEQFRNCSALAEISVARGNQSLYAQDNCLMNGGTLLLGGLTAAIPEGVTAIGAYAFSGRDILTALSIPDSVRAIGAYAFYECSHLETIGLGTGIASLADYTFASCTALRAVTFHGALTEIGTAAFQGCGALGSIDLHAVVLIGELAFENCESLRTIVLGEALQAVLYDAFWNCNNLEIAYYLGTEDDWMAVDLGGNDAVLDPTRVYFYSDTPPSSGGNYWHYEDDLPTLWE